ncbi:hypothetical protein [Kineococcus sp. SYSU DK003]|uniref:hypothetical protein n=1 Tax=Kineococcus sp. SYSU DK003 TaxID=3383124 RepID=UPI003D7DC26C
MTAATAGGGPAAPTGTACGADLAAGRARAVKRVATTTGRAIRATSTAVRVRGGWPVGRWDALVRIFDISDMTTPQRPTAAPQFPNRRYPQMRKSTFEEET